MEWVVGTPRFELGTPCTPCKCATRLRHVPPDLPKTRDGVFRGGRIIPDGAEFTEEVAQPTARMGKFTSRDTLLAPRPQCVQPQVAQ